MDFALSLSNLGPFLTHQLTFFRQFSRSRVIRDEKLHLSVISERCPQHNRLTPPPPGTRGRDSQDTDSVKCFKTQTEKKLSLCVQFLLCFFANGEFRYLKVTPNLPILMNAFT